MTVQPLGDRVVVKALSQEEVTKSGIYLPDTAKDEKPEQGEVIAVGPGKLLENGQRAPIAVAVGDSIVFKKYGPDEVKIDGEEFLILSEEDILAKIV